MSKESKSKTLAPLCIEGEINKEEEAKLFSILDALDKDPLSYEFREPVDVVGLNLIDYYDYIKYPMDLSTIKKKLKNKEYVTIQDTLDDLQQIWTNCKIYNPEGSEFHKLAELLEKQTRKLIEKTFKHKISQTLNKKENNGTSEFQHKTVFLTYKEKVEFTELIRIADASILALIVERLNELSPEALSYDNIDKNDLSQGEEVSIIVDNISKQALNHILPLFRK